MGTKRARQKQEELFYARERAEAPGHPFYEQLNGVLDDAGFDRFCEEQCRDFYHTKLGRPSLAPGVYFRLLLIGFFEGIGSERGIGWRVADSFSLRRFLNYGFDEATPDHVTISRTRRLLDEATHRAIFRFVLTEVARRGMLKGKTIGIDATSLERTRRCARLCGATRARVTWNICGGWRRRRALTALTTRCGEWIASGKRRRRMTSG